MTIAASYLAGSIPTWILVILAVAVAWRVSRGGGGSAVQELSKANEVLTKRKDELGAEVRDLKAQIASLEARTDFAKALKPVVDEGEQRAEERHKSLLEAAEHHELRAQSRFERTVAILGLVADKLGGDENGKEQG